MTGSRKSRMVTAFSEGWLRRLEAAICGGPVREYDRNDRVWLVDDGPAPVEVATVREFVPAGAASLAGRVVSPASDQAALQALGAAGLEPALVEDGGSAEAFGLFFERVMLLRADPVDWMDPQAPAKHGLLALLLAGAAAPADHDHQVALGPLRAAAAIVLRGDEMEPEGLAALARTAGLWPAGMLLGDGLPLGVSGRTRQALRPGAEAVWEAAAEMLDLRRPAGFRTAPAPRPVLWAEPAPAGDPQDAAEIERHAHLAKPVPLLPMPDLGEVQRAMDEAFPWLVEQTRAVIREAALFPGGAARLPPLLLSGPPGSGKSTYARRLFRASGLPVRTVSATDGNGASTLGGSGRGWRSGRPAAPLAFMTACGVASIGIVVDDVDRQASGEAWGSPQNWLLAALEPSTARRFFDPFLLAEGDFSSVNWALTANDLRAVTGALKDRCLVLEIGYPPPDVAGLIIDRLVRQVEREAGRAEGDLRLPAEAREVLVKGFAQDPATLRGLGRVVRAALGAALLGEDAVAVARAGLARLTAADDRPYAAKRSVGFTLR